ncbi:hypothetical protein D9M71_682260 [compost metagenome]
MNMVKVIFSGVMSMMLNPFFSVIFSASSIPISCDGLDSTVRNAEGNTRSPVPSVPVRTTSTGRGSSSSPLRWMRPAEEAWKSP